MDIIVGIVLWTGWVAALAASGAALVLWRRRLTLDDVARGALQGNLTEHLRWLVGRAARSEAKDLLQEFGLHGAIQNGLGIQELIAVQVGAWASSLRGGHQLEALIEGVLARENRLKQPDMPALRAADPLTVPMAMEELAEESPTFAELLREPKHREQYEVGTAITVTIPLVKEPEPEPEVPTESIGVQAAREELDRFWAGEEPLRVLRDGVTHTIWRWEDGTLHTEPEVQITEEEG